MPTNTFQRHFCSILSSLFIMIAMIIFTYSAAYAEKQAAPEPPGKVIELKYATIRGPSDINAERWEIPLGNEIEKQTGGRIKIKHYWSEALGKGRDQFDLVKNGVADMTDFPGAYAPGKFLMSEIGNLPFAATKVGNIRAAMNKMLAKGLFEAAWGEVQVLAWNIAPFYQILFKKNKPLTFDEIAGLKIRTPGGYMTEFLKAIKAVPVNISPAEAYQAWEKGIVEAWFHPPGAFRAYKLYEIPTKSLLQIDAMMMANACVIFNKDKWAALDPDDQKIIRKIVSDYQTVYDQAGAYQDELSYKLLAEKGVEVYRLPDSEMEKMKKESIKVWEKYISDVDKAGGDGKAMVNEFITTLKELGENPYYKP